MITYLESSLFDSPAQTLVNTVNTVGVMGKGVAKEFKSRFPEMFREYKTLCDNGSLRIGHLHLWRGDNRWVLNFPTKTTWRKSSEMSYVEAGLRKFVETYERLGVKSVSFPPLGCGNGNLDWSDVKPLMEHYLGKVSIPVYIHSVHVAADFVPEHREAYIAPTRFRVFLRDLCAVVNKADGQFRTKTDSLYKARIIENHALEVFTCSGRVEHISDEMLEETWLRLRDHILSIDSFSDSRSKKLKSYLFPILATLPYVRTVEMKRDDRSPNTAIALYFDRSSLDRYHDANSQTESQGCLFH